MNAETVEKKLQRLALELVENNLGAESLILVGIEENGVVLAKNIRQRIQKNSRIPTELLTLRLNKKKPEAVTLSREMDFTGKVIVLIDDVTNSGQTLLYALKPFLDYHPARIQTLVLVERTHTLFPITPDYRGISLATTLQDHIYVEVDGDKVTGAYLA
ncbi:pyrimidine operon attenuation protein / uracil phosphoribosyltransferase [Niabella drilacis]|uniref:Pyrimidine operon attenuation protein / uracil phosphoribosyltransferase n=1 Tax=Niabella drilacis (strain DSM 25811 / CCM 8410 / CCUG 62505 / LMG 26954 / E90) TaxID=1285928 RepID=A0A1G6LLQ6_NIADE|nr:pyrimidine operon attenuation protein / uracil phosphoribosyltransferase [Niabella drilacis]